MLVATSLGEFHVDESGQPAGPPVLLWPSLYCTGAIFAPQAHALGAAHRVLTLDPPGHGHSALPPVAFSLEDTAKATVQVLDAFGIDRAAIVGGAWGGMVAVQMAAIDSARISHLVLINSPLDRWRGRNRASMTGLYVLLKAGGPGAVAGLLANGMLSATTRKQHPELVDPLRAMFTSLNRTAVIRSARSAMIDRPSLRPVLADLAVPTLVLTGSEDAFVPVALARSHAAMIPGSRFEVIDGTAHLSAYEAPIQVNELVLPFLAS